MSQALGFVNLTNDQGHTEVVRYDVFVALLFKQDTLDLMRLHAALGVCGEAGELADAIKKNAVYGKTYQIRENIVEELGDLMFYMQAVMKLYDIDEQEALQHNANKLSERYKGLRYSDEAAINRADKAPGE